MLMAIKVCVDDFGPPKNSKEHFADDDVLVDALSGLSGVAGGPAAQKMLILLSENAPKSTWPATIIS
jgi:hypothetical protein